MYILLFGPDCFSENYGLIKFVELALVGNLFEKMATARSSVEMHVSCQKWTVTVNESENHRKKAIGSN
jgi:hypothetical protein